jgi:hypothetical protein
MENYTQIPIVIIAWNNLFFVRKFVNQILRLQQPIVIIDNNSTYKPMLEYYISLKMELKERLTIHLLDKNYGHEVYVKLPHLLPEVYVISDPDLELNPMMPSNAIEHLLMISTMYELRKTGLALDISDSEKFIPGEFTKLVYGIESNYYKNKVIDQNYELYIAPTDTTFCLINKKHDENRNLRVAGPFTAKHLPWYNNYLKENIPRDELEVWIRENKSSCILKHIDPQSLLV